MFKSIRFILIVLTNKNVALIYSITICQQETEDCALSASKVNCCTVVFNIDVCRFS